MALAEKKISFEIIPGITAGIGAAAYAGIPLTHRDDATSTLFITGHQCQTSNDQDWKTIAKLQSTLVFYMASRRLNEIVKGLIENGKDKTTPIAIIINATLNSQKIILSSLDNILEEFDDDFKLTPAIIIIGEVVNNHTAIQDILKTMPSSNVDPISDMGFNIWKTNVVDA